MKIAYAVLIAIVWCIVFYHLLQLFQRTEEIVKDMLMVVLFGLVSITAQFGFALSNDNMAIDVIYGVYFACLTWMIYYLMIFAFHYTKTEVPKIMHPRLMGMVIGIDSINMMTNFIFHHAIVYQESWYGNELYMIFYAKPGYNIHLALCYGMCLVGGIAVLKKVLSVPKLYKSKYSIIIFYVAIIIITNLLFYLRITKFDISVLFYGIFLIHLYHNTLVFAPRKIVDSVTSMITNHFKEAFVIWDNDGLTIYQNDKAANLFGEVESRRELFERISFDRENVGRSGAFRRYEYFEGSKRKILDLQFEELYTDKKDQLIASYLIVEDVTDDIRRIEKQQYMALHDPLTGLYNRLSFFDHVKDTLDNDTKDHDYVLMVSDIHGFKLINDTYGTEMGDRILKAIADRIRKVAPAGSVYARLEKDTFAMLLERSHFSEETFNRNLDDIFKDNGNVMLLENYYGVYEIIDKKMPVAIMVDRAMMALNSVMGDYKEHFGYYEEGMRQSILEERKLLSGVESAIHTGEFVFYIQGQVNPVTKNMVGGEALVRWVKPDGSIVSPGKFIPILEKNGAIEMVDRFIWEEVCKLLKKWKEEGHPERSISVNISPKDFFFSNVYETFTELVKKYDINPHNLKLEITESAIMIDVDKQIDLMQKLSDAGFILEMDDFGSAYSSLNMLKDLPTKILKLDQVFIRNPRDLKRSSSIVRSVVKMAHDLGMKVIAEGVETEEQVRYFKEIQCDAIQGFYYCKPIPVEDFEHVLHTHDYEDIMDGTIFENP